MNKIYTMSTDGLNEELNKGIESFVEAILKEGIISKEQAEEMSQYSVLVMRKGVLGRIWNYIFKEKDTDYYFVVKVIKDLPPKEKGNEDE